jgi:hypothetical protein
MGTAKPAKKHGLCRFCDRDGALTDEDLVPKWGGRVLRAVANGRVDVVLSTRQLDRDGKTTLRHAHERRQTFSAVKLPGVCETCNNGWMSRIENDAKPFLEPMVRDIRTGIPRRSLVVVARWLALKTLVADLVEHSHHTATPDDYHAFFADPDSPGGFEAFLGRVDLKGAQQSYFYLQPHLAAQARDGLRVNEPISLQFDLSMGPLWAQALYVRLGARKYPRGGSRPTSPWWARLWPQSEEANWPPPRSFTLEMLPEGISNFPEAAEWIERNAKRNRSTGRSGAVSDG